MNPFKIVSILLGWVLLGIPIALTRGGLRTSIDNYRRKTFGDGSDPQ